MTTENTVKAILITGTPDNDSILNFGDDVTIDSGSGNDTIYSGLDDKKADRVSINAGAGNNVVSIQSGSDSVTIRTADGNNLIGSTSPNNAVFSGAGNDSVVFYTGADNNTMETGDGDDIIDAVGHNVTIDAGGGNDRIRTYRNAYDITIKGSTGDDEIILGGPVDTDHTNVVQYADGDGFDTITDFSATDTLQITSGNISGATLVGNNVEISVGSGKITLVEANNMNINIIDAEGNLNQTIFSGGSIDDTVVNDTVIVGTDGDDYLINDKGKNVTINALGGNDTIDNTGDNSIIEAGAGNDIVSVAGASFVTIRTDEGDNRVYIDNNGASEVVYFGEGSNTIVASNRNSTIIGGGGGNVVTLHNGSFGSYVESGSGNDTVAVGHYDITVDAQGGNDLINLYRDAENTLIKMGGGNDTVMIYNNTHEQTFEYSGGNDIINGFDANDTLRIVGHAPSSSVVSDGNLILGLGDGSLTLAGVSSAESLNVEYVGKWSTIDGGFVYSGHATNNYAKTADVSLIGADLKDTNGDGAPDNVSVNSFTYSNVTGVMAFMSGLSGEVTLNDKDLGVSGDNDYEVHFTAKVIDNASEAVKAYAETKEVRGISTGATVTPNADDIVGFDENAKAHMSDVTNAFLYNKNRKAGGSPHAQIGIANGGAGADLTTEDGILTKINGLENGYSVSLVSSDNVSNELKFNDIGSGSFELTSDMDDTVQVNFSGTTSAQSITGNGNSVELIGSKGDDLLIGNAATVTQTGGKGSDTFRGGANLESALITDYTEGEDVIYHGRPFSEFSLNGYISGKDYIFDVVQAGRTITVKNAADKVITVTNVDGETRFFGKYLTLDDNDPATMTAQSGVATIDATRRTEDIKIIGNSGNNTIIGGGDNSTFEGGAGDDLIMSEAAVNSTMTGGKGSDTFRGGANLDFVLITDYTEGEDVIYHGRPFADLSINGSIEGSDYVFYVGNKTIAVKDGADKVITVTNVDGETRFFGKYLTLDDNDPATVTAQDGVETIDATRRTEDIVINGNSGNNTIISSSGDCTLYGGGGKNTFVRGNRTAEQIITVADYTEGEDEVYHERPFSAFSLLSVAKSVGDDYIFGTSTAMSRYTGGANKKIKFVDVNGNVAYFGNYITIMDVDSATVEATEKVKVLDATERTKAINLTGNSLDNTIYSGTGNDTLTGNDGSDLFAYSAGNDIITDYTEDDKISLGAAVSSSLISDAAAILTTDAGTLTIQNADGKTLNLIDSAGEEFSIKATGATQIINDVTAQASSVENISAETTATLESGEAAIIAKTSAPVNITAGDNTIVSQGENVHVSLTGGNTRIFPLEGRMTLEGYDEATGSGFGTTYTNISSAVENGRIDFANGTLALGSAQVDMGTNSALMNFYNRDGKQQKVGYASQNDSLDASGKTDDLLLVAKQNGSITGGSGDDTILASEGSYVDGGAGKNLVKSNGATVALNGRTTVQGAVDTVYIAGADPSVDFKAGGLSFYDNNADKSLTFSGVHSTSKLNLYYADSNALSTQVFIADDDWYNVADSGAAQYYVGATASKNHGIDFSGVSEALDVTLNTDYAADTTMWINNIHSIRGGAGSTKITGSDKNDTILAGTGETSIYGGAGHDTIKLTANSLKPTAIFYTAGDGRDSISNLGFITDAQDATADKVQLNDSGVSEVFLRGSDVMIKVDNADGFLMIEGAQGKSFRLNDDLIAKVDKNVSFDGYTNSYVGIGTQATLTVGKGLGDVEVWLSDDSLEYHGTRYDGNFAVLDASQSDGRNILAGNELSNVITGGSGENNLWGGYSSENDTLIGGAGKNTFFYGAGNGRDVIRNTHDGDVISLEDITLEQITDANITAHGVALNFNDGGALFVDGTADVTYRLQDGSTYTVDRTNREFR